ncbi:hypothetical protein OBBRIDRAFT_829038 [Obba rivulosa]|uniref:Uncharacterized protein n=1 Tax=Obba rivulosa TaxID=1052685 RepID=A0A8E2DEU2_9APHY|nr:hypothetical protein OBBRIDRAFT_829038 [Obba rivulosa]
MATNIEQAISTLLRGSQPLTLSNVLRAYLRVAGLAPVEDGAELVIPHDALVAFEHALDKEPVFAVRHRPFTQEIAQLRRTYWEERLGAGAGSASRCTCPSCGKTVKCAKEAEQEGMVQGEEGEKRRGGARRRVKKKRVPKRRDASSDRSVSYDPYGPSTSACLLELLL